MKACSTFAYTNHLPAREMVRIRVGVKEYPLLSAVAFGMGTMPLPGRADDGFQ